MQVMCHGWNFKILELFKNPVNVQAVDSRIFKIWVLLFVQRVDVVLDIECEVISESKSVPILLEANML